MEMSVTRTQQFLVHDNMTMRALGYLFSILFTVACQVNITANINRTYKLLIRILTTTTIMLVTWCLTWPEQAVCWSARWLPGCRSTHSGSPPLRQQVAILSHKLVNIFHFKTPQAVPQRRPPQPFRQVGLWPRPLAQPRHQLPSAGGKNNANIGW